MIPYVEIINKTSLKVFDLIEPSQCWFELSYYEVGQFQVYCQATQKNLAALQKGNYIKLPNKRWLWVITAIEYNFTVNGTRMISATGYEAKWILNKRIIMTPSELPNTLANAVYSLVYNNLGAGAIQARRITGLTVELHESQYPLSSEQATRDNLMEYTLNLLKTNKCGCQIIYDNGGMVFKMLFGRTLSNTIVFSQSLDNLFASTYKSDDTKLGTFAYVVSNVNDIDYPWEYDTNKQGINRSEILINSNLSTKYLDRSNVEQELDLTNATDLQKYNGWQEEEGKKALAERTTIEEVSGQIDLSNSIYTFDVDYYLGDKVKILDEYFNFSIITRILKYTISQDANGYAEAADYGEQEQL